MIPLISETDLMRASRVVVVFERLQFPLQVVRQIENICLLARDGAKQR
jgi:hypothetical protein